MYKYILGLTILILGGIIVGGILIDDPYFDKSVIQAQIIQHDPVPDVIMSIAHKGKLVVTDANIIASASSHTDSSIYRATVDSTQTARVQVWLDLALFRKEWVVQGDKSLDISIPASAIKSEVIPTKEVNQDNDSWGFWFDKSAKDRLIKSNQKQIKRQLNQEASSIRETSMDMVAAQVGRLFSAALSNQNYKIDVKIDRSK